jgi:CHAD domain-containing protein
MILRVLFHRGKTGRTLRPFPGSRQLSGPACKRAKDALFATLGNKSKPAQLRTAEFIEKNSRCGSLFFSVQENVASSQGIIKYLASIYSLSEHRMALDSDRIRKTVRKLRKFFRKAPKHPTPEEVHDLRTHIRRLENAINALDPAPSRLERRLVRDLSQVRKRAGKVRDMDVLTSNAVSMHVSAEQDSVIQLLQYLGARRYEYADRLRAAVQRDAPGVRRRVKRVKTRLVERAARPIHDSSNGRPTPASSAAASAIQLTSELSTPRALNEKNLHPYRLKVKELRDFLLLAEKPADEKFVDILGQVKDAIGDWHDWQELSGIAGDLLDHDSGSKLRQKLKVITDARYKYALSLTNRMRNQFASRGQDKRMSQKTLAAIGPLAS